MPELSVGALKAGKGLDRHIAPEAGWEDELPIRQTVLLRRFSSQIEMLPAEDWTHLTKAQQRRHAKPSHIMICVFASDQKRSVSDGDRPVSNALSNGKAEHPKADTDTAVQEISPSVPVNPVDVPTWTPVSASVSGPRFLDLSEADQGIIRKLHTNLGHHSRETGETSVRSQCQVQPGKWSPGLSMCFMCRKSQTRPINSR